jgi:hypothetical protein
MVECSKQRCCVKSCKEIRLCYEIGSSLFQEYFGLENLAVDETPVEITLDEENNTSEDGACGEDMEETDLLREGEDEATKKNTNRKEIHICADCVLEYTSVCLAFFLGLHATGGQDLSGKAEDYIRRKGDAPVSKKLKKKTIVPNLRKVLLLTFSSAQAKHGQLPALATKTTLLKW